MKPLRHTQSSLQLQTIFVQQVLAAHRRIQEPAEVNYLGHLVRIHPRVFSPFIAPSGRVGLSLATWPIFRGKRVLDLGCGSGIFACFVAMSGASHVVGIDVNPYAVANARANASALGVEDLVEIRHGDLFGPVRESESYDVIFADLPFSSGDPTDDLERAFFDKDLESIRRFFREVPSILRRTREQATAYMCLSNLEPVEPLLDELDSRVLREEVMRITVGVIELYLYELRTER